MSSKFDEEYVEGALIQLVKNNLASKLDQIDTEKNDSIILDDVSTSEYYNTLDDTVVNSSIFILYGLNDGSASSLGFQTALNLNFFCIVYFDTLNMTNARARSFRYIRALREIFEEHQQTIPGVSLTKISSSTPQNYQESESSPNYKVGGVMLELSIVV